MIAREGHQGLPRLLAGLDSSLAAMTLREHERIHGPLPGAGRGLIDEIGASGLRGRGGADFPTAVKLDAVARRRRASAVVVNASETEPASAKDRLLISRLPHLVLDGAVLAAEVCGAREVIVKLGPGMSPAPVEAAISVRSGDTVPIGVAPGADGYVTGEESAVINALERRPGDPDAGAAAAVRTGLPRTADVDPEPRDACPDRTDRAVRRRLVSRARDQRRSRVGAGDDLRGCGFAGRLRARLRDADDRPAGGGRRTHRGPPRAARRRLLRHLGRSASAP